MKSTTRLPLLLLVLTGPCSASDSRIIAAQVSDCYADDRHFIAAEYSDSTPLQVFSFDPFEEPIGYSMVIGDVREKVLQRFGEPKNIKIAFEFDKYSVELAQIRFSTLHYPGLKIVIADRPGNSEAWLNGIEITGEQYRLKYKLGVGANHQDVLDALQPGSYTDTPGLLKMRAELWEKQFGDCPEHDSRVDASVELVFEFDATDQVSNIMWIPLAGH